MAMFKQGSGDKPLEGIGYPIQDFSKFPSSMVLEFIQFLSYIGHVELRQNGEKGTGETYKSG